MLMSPARQPQLHRFDSETRVKSPFRTPRLGAFQYLGFALIMIGFFFQWPTLVTGLMLPGLRVMYWHLSKREEREMKTAFGDAYHRRAQEVPAFLPRFGRLFKERKEA